MYFYYSDLSRVMENVAEQVNKTVNDHMTSHGFCLRTESQQTTLTGQIKDLASKEHAVYKLMGYYIAVNFLLIIFIGQIIINADLWISDVRL